MLCRATCTHFSMFMKQYFKTKIFEIHSFEKTYNTSLRCSLDPILLNLAVDLFFFFINDMFKFIMYTYVKLNFIYYIFM